MFNKVCNTLILALLLPLPALANDVCHEILALGATQATGPTTFVGDAHSNLGSMSVNVEITSTRPNADGSLTATTAHTFTGRGLVFTTSDRARLVPMNDQGHYRLDTQATIVDGTWLELGVWGHLKLDGLINLVTGQARWLAEGVVCAK